MPQGLSHRSLYRFLTVILPRSSQELDRWQQRALYAGRPLSQQALDSFSKNHLCLKGGMDGGCWVEPVSQQMLQQAAHILGQP